MFDRKEMGVNFYKFWRVNNNRKVDEFMSTKCNYITIL